MMMIMVNKQINMDGCLIQRPAIQRFAISVNKRQEFGTRHIQFKRHTSNLFGLKTHRTSVPSGNRATFHIQHGPRPIYNKGAGDPGVNN